MWWGTAVIPGLENNRWRQEDQKKVKVILRYIGSLRPAWAAWDPEPKIPT